MKLKFFKLIFLLTIFSVTNIASAQADGPRSYLLIPKGVTSLNVKWMGLEQNVNSTGSILIPGAKFTIDLFPVTAFHTFSIKGRFAQVSFMANPGEISGSAKNVPPVIPLPMNRIKADGFSDGFVGFKLGLFGAPALGVEEYLKKPMKFSLFTDLRLWYSGSYDPEKVINLGTNRLTYQIGFPMAIPLNDNLERQTWLEVNPSLSLFGANNDPALGTNADKIDQNALFSVESHLSHNFTKKFWVFGNALYKQGGQTISDGEKNDNTLSTVLMGAGVGYQIMPFIGLYCDYGGVVVGGSNDVESQMFRVSLNFSYVKLKKQ
jgi:hypothetical protein